MNIVITFEEQRRKQPAYASNSQQINYSHVSLHYRFTVSQKPKSGQKEGEILDKTPKMSSIKKKVCEIMPHP
jgi:hypothetical protein